MSPLVWIIAGAIVVGLAWLLKNKAANSANVIVTGPGVLKTHDVEAKFRSESRKFLGKLAQSRWSDGQERFSLRLQGLTADHGGKLSLYRNGDLVSEFDISGSAITFRWKGISSDAIPKFEIGDQVRVDVGAMSLSAIVEPD